MLSPLTRSKSLLLISKLCLMSSRIRLYFKVQPSRHMLVFHEAAHPAKKTRIFIPRRLLVFGPFDIGVFQIVFVPSWAISCSRSIAFNEITTRRSLLEADGATLATRGGSPEAGGAILASGLAGSPLPRFTNSTCSSSILSA